MKIGMMNIIGRKKEQRVLQEVLRSKHPEFVAIYGRRRVGKTFLVRTFFEKQKVVFFNVTGKYKAPLQEQLAHFVLTIGEVFYQNASLSPTKNWEEAFELLFRSIQALRDQKPIVLFFDEIPWMSTKNSRLLQTLDHYWNHRFSRDPRIKLIICGSSASWIIEKIIRHKGGLHNRITRNIYLLPFDLKETEYFLQSRGIELPRIQIVELYMAMGGIPHYLNQIQKGLSSGQNISELAFEKKSFLSEEFFHLFSSLFDHPEDCMQMIHAIAQKPQEITQKALFQKLGSSFKGKKGLNILRGLEDAYFIMSFQPLYQSKGIYYKMVDPYCIFYFHWIRPVKGNILRKGLGSHYWLSLRKTSSWHSWSGLAFEALCYEHLPSIQRALRLGPLDRASSWKYQARDRQEPGGQIDLLFDREDDAITLCEIKFTEKPFVLNKSYAQHLVNLQQCFQSKTKTRKKIFWAIISAQGLKNNSYSEALIDEVVTLDDFFN